MEIISHWVQKLLEEWDKRTDSRYPVLVVIPSGPGKIIPEVMVEFASLIRANVLDFEERYAGRLSRFIGRADVLEEIIELAADTPVVVTNVEHFYDKWTITERIDFIRHILRRDGHRGIVLLLYCNENLSPIVNEVGQNERGAIWNP
jgi:hypothetical protein